MRLLEILSNGDFRLTKKFLDNAIPRYAILSHRWGDESQEVTYEDMAEGLGQSKPGYEKIKFCGQQAVRDGLQYFWVDSCCIRKSHDAELSESLNSMFRWYRHAEKCYVYLPDVSSRKRKRSDENTQNIWEQAFQESNWFTRGWTLQELLAPSSLQFFSKEGDRIGDKQSLKHQIHNITGIPFSALRGSALSQFSISQRFDWAKNRRTAREEDWAYCLLGIFEVSMPVLYGEGKRNAVRRLRKVIDDASKDKECLRDLYVTDPRKDKIRIEETKGGLIPESYHWILENCEFKQWCSDLQSHLLWIKGDPGKGKTMLLCGIIDELKSTEETHLLSFFFCQATDSRINNAIAVLRGLLFMLIDQQPSLILYIQKQHDYAGKALFQDANAWVALSDIFTSVLQDPNLKRTYFIIDALDECVAGQERLLDFIVQMSSTSSRVKWLISSRNWSSIEERLGKAGSKIRLSLELNSESISAAVSMFTQHKVYDLAQEKKYDDKTRDIVLNYLSSNANGTFLWVALVVKNFRNIPRGRIRARLKSFPPGLDSLYERMMKQIYESEDSELCMQILASIVTLYEPIAVTGLTSIIKMLEELSNDIESLEEIISLCGSFLVIRDNIIYFVHQSAKDYLLEKAYVDVFPSGVGDIHHKIFSRSLVALSRTLRRDMYGLSSVGYPIELVNPPDPDPLLALHQMVDLQDGGPVDMFMREKFLYWLEALSLCRSTSKGLVAMARLETLVKGGAGEPSLFELVHDAHRFLRSSKQAIEASPLQAYVSALLFSPACSLIRRCFEKEEPDWIRIMPAVKDTWGARLQTLEGHRKPVKQVTFSHDSTRIASSFLFETIQVWDTSSGDCLSTLEFSANIMSITFSHTSTELLTVSDNGTVQVWDVNSSECLQTLEAQGGNSVSSVAFSCDLRRFGSASKSRVVQIWDVTSGEFVQTFEGFCDLSSTVTFSRDSTKLASTLRGSTIKVWNIYSRQCLLTLVDHSDQVIGSLVFSHDSTQLASVSHDRMRDNWTIKVWDLSSGDCLQTFTSFRGEFLNVFFSHDLNVLVLTREGMVVKVFDTSSGKCLWTLSGIVIGISWLALSNDTNSTWVALACGKRLERVRVWDIASGECLQTLEGFESSVSFTVFSNDARLLASGSNGTVKVWNIDSGECLRTFEPLEALEDHSRSTDWVTFSQDSTWLLLVSGETVEVWNIDSGERLCALEGHCNSLRFKSVVLSQDSTLLVLEAVKSTVKVWDLSDNQCLQTLEGHNSHTRSVVFSHDSTKVASASKGLVGIWDIDNGECVQKIERPEIGIFTSVAISNNFTRLVLSGDNVTQVWNIKSGECLWTLLDYTVLYDEMTLSRDSARLALALGGTVSIWNIESGELLQTCEGNQSPIRSVALSNDSRRLIAASNDGTVNFWDTGSPNASPTIASTAESHRCKIMAIILSYDSTRLVSGAQDGTIELWDVSSGECIQTFQCLRVSAVAFSYRSRRLILGTRWGRIMVWDIDSGQCLWEFDEISDILSIALPYKQDRFASLSYHRTISIWDLKSGTKIRTFEKCVDCIEAIALSHDLTRLASVLGDHTIRIWDAINGECLQMLKGSTARATSVTFSSDSIWLASSSEDGIVRIWDTNNSECLQMLDIGRAVRDLSFDTSGSKLYTEIGAFAFDATLASNTTPGQIARQNPGCLGVGLSPNGEWITYNSEKLVWLPSEYRPEYSAVSGRTIGIGNATGKVWMCTLQVTRPEL
ncbi:MAG: hypothetical protein Q9165_002106 [Trypethelium subeluteriae]